MSGQPPESSLAPEDALDRLLALRPDELEGWERSRSAGLPEARRRRIERLDAGLTDLLEAWSDAPPPRSGVTVADVLARQEEAPPAVPEPAVQPDRTPRRSPVRHRPRLGPPPWLLPASLAASLALVGLSGWLLGGRHVEPGTRLKSVGLDSTRVELQFAVERASAAQVGASRSPQTVEAGRDGQTLSLRDGIALRFDVQGAGGYVWLLEVADGEPRLLYPFAGQRLQVGAGAHPLVGVGGAPLVYRPETPGTFKYLALVTDAPVPPVTAAQGVLEAGETRPDRWPRHVLSSDGFTLQWQE